MIPSAVVALELSTCLDRPAHERACGDSGCKPPRRFHGLYAPFFHLVNGGVECGLSPPPPRAEESFVFPPPAPHTLLSDGARILPSMVPRGAGSWCLWRCLPQCLAAFARKCSRDPFHQP